ncbi:hypothetical protein ACM64Y_00505 [Novispirillum sp. DQ9]|uniref:hypothetical protein n=1 Tax=Novispirillum sp. DQ9 TaxID=3398612 RepID=UPI003C7B91CB
MQKRHRIMKNARKALSFVLLLKAMAGFSVATLTLAGVALPQFGIEPTAVGGGAAAVAGAVIGAIVAIKA